MVTDAPLELLFMIGDLHAGSTVGLLAPDFYKTDGGNHIGQNVVQRWLWMHWMDATTRWMPSIAVGSKYGVVLTGDLTEGIHHKSLEVISPDFNDHFVAAKQILAPVAEGAEKVYVVRGTECHVGTVENAMGDALGAEQDPYTGIRAFDRLTLDVKGCRNVFRHHIDATSRTYLEAGALSIHLGVEQLEAAKAGHPIPRTLTCAHRHRYGTYSDGGSLATVTPPWQMLTRHGHKVVGAAVTKPGIVAYDWRGLPDGSLPKVHNVQYVPAPPQALTL